MFAVRRLYRIGVLLATLIGILASSLFAQAHPAASSTPHRVYLPSVQGGAEKPDQPDTRMPLSIMVTYDSERAVSAAIGPDGGQLSAVGADGTHYTLAIPAGALSYTRTLTMTPSAAFGGLPFSGDPIGAVQLTPANLWLMQPAVLTITAADMGSESYAFGFDNGGDAFHLRVNESAVQAEGGPEGVKIITIKPQRLRSYGAARGNKTDIEQYRRQHRPERPADQVAEDDFLQSLDPREILAHQRRVHTQIMESLSLAARDTISLDRAIMLYEEWIRPIQRMPWLKEQLAAELYDFKVGLRTAVRDASRVAAQRCTAEHDPAIGLQMQRWLYTLYTYALPMDTSEIETLASKCLTFDLVFLATFSRTSAFDGTTVQIDTDVAATVRLTPRFAYPRFQLAGQSELRVNQAGITSSPCRTVFTRTGAEPVRAAELIVSPHPSGEGIWVDALYFDTGRGIKGNGELFCPPPSVPHTAEFLHLYSTEFTMMHQNEMISNTDGGGVFRIAETWNSVGAHDLIATTGAAYVRTRFFPGPPGTTIGEDSLFELYYRPQP